MSELPRPEQRAERTIWMGGELLDLAVYPEQLALNTLRLLQTTTRGYAAADPRYAADPGYWEISYIVPLTSTEAGS